VPEHEHYLEMWASASIGQLPPEQLATLGTHLKECAECRAAYADYAQIAGLEYALREQDVQLGPEEAVRYLDSTPVRALTIK
jgi:predicted anti-sigma-YlaC factor YlaD